MEPEPSVPPVVGSLRKDRWKKAKHIDVARGAAGAALFWALFPNPYGYYVFLRWLICAVAGLTAHQSFKLQRHGPGWFFVGIAVLFNPVFPFYLARSTWGTVDILAALAFLWSIGSLKVQRPAEDLLKGDRRND